MTDESVPEVEVTVKVPAATHALANGVAKLIQTVVAQHKAGGGVIGEVAADVKAAIDDLGPVLKDVGLLGGDVKADPVGVAEAFLMVGLETARELGAK